MEPTRPSDARIAPSSSPPWEPFVYCNQPPLGPVRSAVPLRSLATTPVGDRVTIVAVMGDDNCSLLAMGLLPGVVAQVVNRTASGSVMIALPDHRLALGREIAERIQIEAIPGEGAEHPAAVAVSMAQHSCHEGVK